MALWPIEASTQLYGASAIQGVTMKLSHVFTAAALFGWSFAAPAYAAIIGNGTLAASDNFVPTIVLSSPGNSFTATNGMTFNTMGSGEFTGVTGLTGRDNGTIRFSSDVGTTITQTIKDFFVFDDRAGGTYNFSVESALTQSFVNYAQSSSFALYLLGTTINTNLNKDPTPTSLTLQFNRTGNSSYSASQTLAVPPAGISVAEPISIALLGTGLACIGFIGRRRML